MTRALLQLPPSGALPESRETVRARLQDRARLLGGTIVFALALLAARGAHLCIEPHPLVRDAGSSQRWGQELLLAPRGDILDRNGRRLATTADSPTVVVDPKVAQEDPEALPALAADVARILGLPLAEVREKLERPGSRYTKLAVRVHPKVAREIQALNHRALWIQRDDRRYYPEGPVGAQVLGFVDGTGVGKEGLENALDTHLRGGAVLVQHRRDRRGYDVDPTDVDQAPLHGMNVHLTIDRDIQWAAERALAAAAERHAPKAAYATVVDVRTGDILAMANWPPFNPNSTDHAAEQRKNHPVADLIEPGSVFKPFTMAAALEEGIVQEDSKIDCEGGSWVIGRTRIRDDHPHGTVSAGEVIKYSSNIGSAKLALKMGPETFLGYVTGFGFGTRTGVTLPGERRGQVRSPKDIRPIELATTSYGQGVTSTQLQMTMATAALANGGVLMKPRLVTLVEDEDGIPVFHQEPEAVRRVVSEDTAAAVRRMMVMVTEPGGTGTRARVPGYLVGGKTGTAEKVTDGVYGNARIGSFMGFLPADDPVLAIVVSVDEPSIGSRYGGIVAAPAFADIGGYAMRHLGIPADPALIPPAKPGSQAVDAEVPLALSQDLPPLRWDGSAWAIPDLAGRTLREALVSLQDAGLRVEVDGSGVVVSQRPAPGERVGPGGAVALVLR